MSGAEGREQRAERGVPARVRLAALCALLGVAACAQPGAPRGGPLDSAPPRVVQIIPDTGAVNTTPSRVVFRLDEVVTERPQGATSLNGLFLISPYDGEPRVGWDRDAITIRPRRGFRPNTVYVITMLPGLVDVQGNATKDGAQAVFSTGPTIPDTRLAGIVFDWPAGRPAQRPFVEAIRLPDSVVYVTIGDSVGGFTFRYLAPGRYAVRATVDQNNNRRTDARELYDSVDVTLGDSARVELLAFVHDTIGPRINTVTIRDSLTLRIEFDKPLDPAQQVTAALFSLKSADSAVVPLAGAVTAAAFDSLERERSRARADSAARADTTARGDSARRAARVVRDAGVAGRRVAAAPPGRNPSGVAPASELRDSVPVDTAALPRPSKPSPIREAVITLRAPLGPSTAYRLQSIRVRNLLGHERTSDRVFTTPKPPPAPADSAARPGARPDSAARPAAAPPVRPP